MLSINKFYHQHHKTGSGNQLPTHLTECLFHGLMFFLGRNHWGVGQAILNCSSDTTAPPYTMLCIWDLNDGTLNSSSSFLIGVDVGECALRNDKRKNLLEPVDAWMQMCCWRCRRLVNMGCTCCVCMGCRCWWVYTEKNKRKNLLVSEDAWMQGCVWMQIGCS